MRFISLAGVLMWEVFTCGQMPYDQMRNAEVVDFVCTHNRRLPKPAGATENIYHIMEKCWDKVGHSGIVHLGLK